MWLFIAAECPRCGRPRGEGEPWSYRDGVRYAASGVTNPCGHHEDYTDLVRESRQNARVIIEDDSNPFVAALAREYHATNTRWLRTQPEDAG